MTDCLTAKSAGFTGRGVELRDAEGARAGLSGSVGALEQWCAARGALRLGLGAQRSRRVADTTRRVAFLLEEDAMSLGVGPRVVGSDA